MYFGLRLKIVTILVIVLIALATGTISLFHSQTIRAAEIQEQVEATQSIRRVVLAVDFQLTQLDSVLGAWSNWTSLYDHAARPSPKFVREELGENGLTQAGIDWLLRIDQQGHLAEKVEIPAGDGTRHLQRFIDQNPALVTAAISRIQDTGPPYNCGLMLLDNERFFFCFRPLLNSDGGGPSRGYVVIGRQLSAPLLKEIGQQVGLKVGLVSPSERITGQPTGDLIMARIAQAIPQLRVSESDLTLDYPLFSWFGKDAGALRISMARSAMTNALDSRQRSTMLLVTLILLTGAVMIAVIDHFVVRRISQLKGQLETIVKSKTWNGEISRQGKDEIDQLGMFINSVIEVVREQIVEMRELSLTDPLTGLANRRHFDERYGDALKRHQRSRRPLTLVLFDADSFKKYNDQYGHPAGDAALIAIGQQLRQNARRPGDMAARLGGEEFALLLEETDLNGARHCADGVLRDVFAAALEHAGNPPHGVLTVSAGIAILGAGDTPESLYKRADQALYNAKAMGRNRAFMSAAPLPE